MPRSSTALVVSVTAVALLRPWPSASGGEPGTPAQRSYLGLEVGLAYRELGTRVSLPAELELVSTSHHASGAHLVLARRGADLVVLLLDDRGVVQDQLELPEAESIGRPSLDCTQGQEDVLLGLVPRAADAGSVRAERAWNAEQGKLVPVAGAVDCLPWEPDAPPPQAPAQAQARKGELTRQEILEVVNAHLPAVMACHERHQPDRSGWLTLEWTIEPTGRVGGVRVARNTTGNQPLAACMLGEVRAWRFPAPRGGGPVVVSYPFHADIIGF